MNDFSESTHCRRSQRKGPNAIAHLNILEANNDLFDEPTLGVIANGSFFTSLIAIGIRPIGQENWLRLNYCETW